MSQSISIPDELYRHLAEQAEVAKTSVETLAAHLLEKALSPAADRDLLSQITQAYASGVEPPAVGGWDQIEAELAQTVSPFESLEAAMNHARGRP